MIKVKMLEIHSKWKYLNEFLFDFDEFKEVKKGR